MVLARSVLVLLCFGEAAMMTTKKKTMRLRSRLSRNVDVGGRDDEVKLKAVVKARDDKSNL